MCERFILLQVECEEQMKGALPSLSPSKQERPPALKYYSPRPVFPEAEQNHMVYLDLCAVPSGISGLPQSSQDETEQLMKSGLS